MQLVQIFGPEAVIQQCSKFDYNLTLPLGSKQGDIRKMLQYKLGDDENLRQAYDLLMQMMQLHPKARISVENAIMHPFFDEIRD